MQVGFRRAKVRIYFTHNEVITDPFCVHNSQQRAHVGKVRVIRKLPESGFLRVQ